MRKVSFWLLILLLGLLAAGGLGLWHKIGQATTATLTAQATVDAQRITFLMRYHGAKVARLKDGRWYFLGRNGRWLPLETEQACQQLSLRLAREKNAPCL